ncbi:MAG: prepilin-type N-terminal cleavage/methylation domain-containing protein [Nitrospinae bacterium]|nr:prepilin-type N-terminal cleavage/methylation domain-containing protein [Nitrospinota bacterium]
MKKIQNNSGFTLLELMISLSVFSIIMMGSVKMLVDQRKEYHIADQYLALQGKVRSALDLLAGEVRMAGSGVNQTYSTPVLYAFNDNTTLGSGRSFAVLAFQYNRDDSATVTDMITNDEVMIIGLTDTSSSDTLKAFSVGTYTDAGTTACSPSCAPAYAKTGTISLKGSSSSDSFKLYLYTIQSDGDGYNSNEIIDNVTSFDVTYYLDASNSGFTDISTADTGEISGTDKETDNLGDNSDNDGDGTKDDKGELETITSTTSTTCGTANTTGIFCDSSDGILSVPVSSKGSTQTLTATDSISVSNDIEVIGSASAIELSSAPTIADGTTDGQYVTVTNTGSYPITFQDLDTLTSSNLRLRRSTVTLSPNQSLSLRYSSSLGYWVQQSSAVAKIAMVKMTLTVRSDTKNPKTGEYLVYSGSITTKIRGYAL